MQDVFRRVMAGESIFRSEDDWSAYTKGSNEENARWNPHAWSISPEEFREEHQRGLGLDPCGNQPVRYEDNDAPMAWGVRQNLISIQVIYRSRKSSAVRAARSLPCLPTRRPRSRRSRRTCGTPTHFWICAPSGAQHVDTCCECNYDTWHSRGWCRMEEAALNLERLGDGRALQLVTQPLGEAPSVSTFDKIDRAWNKTQRSNSPLTGAYSCCRMNHVVSLEGRRQNVDRLRQGRA